MTPEMHRNAKHIIVNSEHFDKDCDYFLNQLTETFGWFDALNLFRKISVLALVFDLGWKNFIALESILYYISVANYEAAAKEVDEKGYKIIAEILKNGEFDFNLVM